MHAYIGQKYNGKIKNLQKYFIDLSKPNKRIFPRAREKKKNERGEAMNYYAERPCVILWARRVFFS